MSLVEHDRDFFLWTRQQTDALRRLADTRPNVEVNWDNLIEEIESLGSEQEHAVESHLRAILVHLLALAYSPNDNPRRHWRGEILEQRARVDRRVARNPSLRPRLQELLQIGYPYARRQAAVKLDIETSELAEACPFMLEQVRDADWFPELLKPEGSVG